MPSLMNMESPASAGELACPACGTQTSSEPVECYGKYSLFTCQTCDLHHWFPRAMPDADWYEQMYGGRDSKSLPLEPGHKYFLGDPLAPKRGELLDIGCGTGNFLSAARNAGYQVTGIELDGNAAAFAKEKNGLPSVLPLSISEFVRQDPGKKFDFISFFEVLEHQAEPKEFIENVCSCLRPRGYIALSVPNRERWLTGSDVLDYPPNHFLRWNARSLRRFLDAHGFEILNVQEQLADVEHTALMINAYLRTGLTSFFAGQAPKSFRDVMQMAPAAAYEVLHAEPTLRQRAIQGLSRLKAAACYPAAVALYPYVRIRRLKGTYLYCLARGKH
jgi:SAM-dependent methyltransferase